VAKHEDEAASLQIRGQARTGARAACRHRCRAERGRDDGEREAAERRCSGVADASSRVDASTLPPGQGGWHRGGATGLVDRGHRGGEADAFRGYAVENPLMGIVDRGGVELAGLEPATSWVRSPLRSIALILRGVAT